MTTAEFKTILTLYTPVSNLVEEIDRRRDKRSKRDFSSRILKAGVLLRDQEKIIVTTSVVPSGKQVSSQPRTAAVLDVTTTTTTANSQDQTQGTEV